MTAKKSDSAGDRSAAVPVGDLPWTSWLLGAVLIWFVLVGGTELASLYTSVRVINALIGSVLVGSWLWQLPRRADLTDVLVLGALVTFLVACVASDFERMSFEAATTTTAFAASFSHVRWEIADPRKARALVTVLATCALGLMLLVLPLWTSVWAEWISVDGSPPPLDLVLPVGPYGHRYTIAMLLILTLPALIQMTERRLAKVIAYVGIGLSLVLVFMSGFRTGWLALVVGVALPTLALRVHALRAAGGLAVVGSVVIAMLAVTGSLGSVLGRLVTTASIGARFEGWADSLGLWLADPVFGTGPGAFSSAFTASGWFDRWTVMGRHAHNAIVQLLMETGLLALPILGLLLAAFMVGLRNAQGHRNLAAPLGVATFGLLALADGPYVVANLVVIGLCWAALCTAPVRQPMVSAWSPSWRTAAMGVGALVVAVAVGSTLTASAVFDGSQAAAKEGDRFATLRALEQAVALDPGHAMYWRERGLHRAEADVPGARADLRQAIALNPSDTVAIRALAVLEARYGEEASAVDLARDAVALMPTHGENLSTLAFVASEASNTEAAEEALIELLRRMPWIAASPDWPSYFPTGDDLRKLLLKADNAWEVLDESSPVFAMPQVWLNAVAGDNGPELLEKHGWAGISFLEGIDALLRCDLDGARDTILIPPPTKPWDSLQLTVMIMVARAAGDPGAAEDAVVFGNLRGVVVGRRGDSPPTGASLFWDPGEDRRLYERGGAVPVNLEPRLPTEGAGMRAWLDDPRAAAKIGAPGSGLAECNS